MDKENIKRGAFLKKVRTANLLSEKELAKLLEVEPSDVTVWETGIKYPEDNDTLDALAKILKVSKKELINGEFKKDKKSDGSIEVEYVDEVETEESNTVSTGNKNIILVVLSCIVLFILVVTVVSIINGNKIAGNHVERIEVSDERETIYHEPRNTSEHVIHNTQALNANDSSHYDGSVLLNYGFVKNGNKYVKKTNTYKIEYYNSIFHLVTYDSTKLNVSIDSRNPLIKYTDSNRSKSVVVEMALPYGEVNCDDYVCNKAADYYKYINFLIRLVRE